MDVRPVTKGLRERFRLPYCSGAQVAKHLASQSNASHRRRYVAAVWIAGATVPLFLSAVFVVGCCVLPFHGVVHRLMPLCAMATNVMTGHHAESHNPTPVPAREKQEPVKRIATVMPSNIRLAVAGDSRLRLASSPATSHRSFISLGAIRCDQDVGLHVLVDTFRI